MKKLLTLVLCLFALNSVFGQSTANYTFSSVTNGSLIDMSTGTTDLLATGTYYDDDASTVANIGFGFYFMGVPYTQFSVNSNGQMRLGGTAIAGGSQSPAAGMAKIAPISGDNAIRETGKVHYKVTGTSPNQVLVVEWKDLRVNYSSATETGIYCQIQALLYESTGVIEFRYGRMYNMSTSAQTRGIYFSSGVSAGQIGQITTINTTPTYNTTATSLTTTSFPASSDMINLNSLADGSRTIFTFTPAVAIPADPTSLTFTDIALNTITPNWVDNSTNEVCFLVTRATDAAFTQDVVVTLVSSTTTATTGTAYSLPQTGLTPGTLYYYKIQATSEGNGSTGLTGSQATPAAVPMHGVYTINNTLPTTTPMVHDNTGNFASFTDAINYMNPNGISDDVYFYVSMDQVFTEDCPPITISGTAANTITFQAMGSGANPVIRPTGTTGSYDAGIDINGGDYITFIGIDISIATGSDVEFGYLIRNAAASDGATHNYIGGCKVTLNRANTSSKGIYQYRAVTAADTNGANSYNIYDGVTIENSYMGVYVYGSSSYPDKGCVVQGCTVGAATANDIGGGSSTTNGIRASYQSGITISWNTVRNVSSSTTTYGIYLENGQGTNNIFANKVYSVGTTSTTTSVVYGLRTDINSTYTVNVFNNMVSDLTHGRTTASSTQVIRAMAVGVSGTGTGNFVYNSVLLTEDAFPSSTAMYIAGGTANLANNIFANMSTAGATSKRYCIYRSSGTILSDYNDLYIDNAGTNNFTGYYTADQATLANWQTASGNMDLHSIAVDPTFVSNTDLHTTNQALNGAGTPISGITIDIDTDPRDPVTPDMGADENLAPPAFTCTAPVPGNTMASANSLCAGQPSILTLENVISGTGLSYQWQSSLDNITYADIPNAIDTFYVANLTENTWFQCVVTCQNGPSTGTSTPVQVTFANSILTTTPASRCGVGTVSLEATATPGATINWYDAVADTLMGSGSPWTTPVIDATTTFNVSAEIPASGVVLGNGAQTTSSYQSPFYHLYGGLKTQFLILESELTAAGFAPGDLNTLGINVVSPGITYDSLKINMGPTAVTALTSTFETGLSNVYAVPAASFTTGINTFTFDIPFNWDGTSNIIIEFCWSNNNGGGTGATMKNDPTTFVAEAYQRTDNVLPSVICANPTAYGTLSYRPQFFMNYTPICAGARVPVIATVSTAPAITLTADQTVCNNSAAQIDVTSTPGDYDSFVWTPETFLFTDALCTTPYTAGASAATVYAKTTTDTIITYTCTANNSVNQCSNVATTEVTILPGAPVASASPSEICVSGATTITVDPAVGYGDATFQWQNSTDNVTFTDITGANGISYTTPTITSTTYYKLLVILNSITCTESNVLTVTVNNPQVVSTTPGSRCGVGTVDLTAVVSTGADAVWYASATGGSPLYTGSPFTTPVISTNTDYYVAASMGGTSYVLGAPNTSISAYLDSQTTTTSGINFDILAPGVVINTIDVYPTAAVGSPFTITVKQGTTTVATYSGTTTVQGSEVSPVAETVPVNFVLPVGTGYKVTMSTNPGMIRNDEGDAFPYTIPGVISLTSSTLSGYYYNFYNWQISTGCLSARTLVTATVTTAPAITLNATPDTICEGTSTTLEVTSVNDPNYTYTWLPATTPATGATVTANPVQNTTYVVSALDNSGGTYNGCANSASVDIVVKPAPTGVTASASSNNICLGSSIDLFADADNDTLITVLVNEGFETMPTPPVGWTFINAGTGNAWGYTTTAHSGAYSLTYGYSSTSPADAWAITGPIAMTAGTTYDFSFWYEVASDYYPEKLKVTVGNDATVLAQTTTLWDNNGDTALFNTTWEQAIITFNPTTSGTYYFGFNCYSNADMFRLYVDDVEISSTTIIPATYSWTSLPAEFTSNLQNPTGITPSAAGSIVYTVSAVNSINCSSTASTTVVVDDCTGVEENNDGVTVDVVPNPSNGLFYITVDGINESSVMNIYSVTGQVVYSEVVNNNGWVNKRVDMSNFPKGIYFLRISNDNITHSKKIIVE